MCGIGGIIDSNGHEVDGAELEILSRSIESRGPDSEGSSSKDNVGFIHRRLSIIDLSVKSNQPYIAFHEGAEYHITFNGEIYNFQEIRNQLGKKKVQFETSSDTEVLLWAYILDGKKMVSTLRGMFAFAIHDVTQQEVFFARDQVGKKPLYFSQQNDRFIFCSEIKGIKKLSSNLTLNYEAVNFYLKELSVPQPLTIWNEIEQLPPGSQMTLDLKTSELNQEKYFQFEPLEKLSVSFEEAESLLESSLGRAIDKRKISDVPIGYFLSGGVDSGLIVALAGADEKISTYSVGYANSDMNELPEAKKVADRYQTNHHEIIIEPNVERDLEEIICYFGEPFADASAIPSYYICKEMSKEVKVAVSGDGGDESFGYKSYAFLHQIDKFKGESSNTNLKLKTKLSKFTARLGLSENFGKYENYLFGKANGDIFKRGMAFSDSNLTQLWTDQSGLEAKDFDSQLFNKLFKRFDGDSLADPVTLGSFETRLLNDYLVKVDRTSMANSLEVRSPFLDVDFMQAMLRIPNEYKFQGGVPKYILKSLAEKRVDSEIIKRPKKGFGVPINNWMKDELRGKVDHFLSKEVIGKHDIFNMDYVNQMKNEFYAGRTNSSSYSIWTLFCLSVWMENEF